MLVLLAAVLIGVAAGLRVFTALAAVSVAASLGMLAIGGTLVSFLAEAWAPWILVPLALGEFAVDQLSSTPKRTVPMPFGARILSAALAGGAIGAPSATLLASAVAGIVGAGIGTLGGLALRTRLAHALRTDAPAGLLEDAVAVLLATSAVLAID